MQSQRGWIDVALLSVCFALSLGACALIVRFTRQIWTYRQRFWMQARHSEFEIAALSSVGVLYSITRPLGLYDDLLSEGKPMMDLSNREFHIRVSAVSVSMTATSYVVLNLLLDIWHQYFSAKWAVQMDLAHWRSMMDDDLITEDMSWFVRNKRTWGNRLFLDHLLCVVWACCVLTTVLLTSVLEVSEIPVYMFLCVSAVSMIVLFQCGYPQFQDRVHLRFEKKVLGYYFLCFIAFWIVTSNLPRIFDWKLQGYSSYSCVWIIINCGCTGIYPGLLFIQGPMVISQFIYPSMSISLFCGMCELPMSFPKPKEMCHNLESTNDRPVLRAKARSSSVISMNTRPRESSLNVCLWDMLGNNEAFRSLMGHLLAEFSSENMLCWLECTMYRRRVKELMERVQQQPSMMTSITPQTELTPLPSVLDDRGRSQSSASLIHSDTLRLCADITESQSSLVRSMEEVSDIPRVAQGIADKYLANGSDFQVNVSFSIQSHVLSLVQSINVSSDLSLSLSLFDPILRETEFLLRESLSRFAKTALFAQLGYH